MACPSISGVACDVERDLVAVDRPDRRRGGLAGLLTQMGGTRRTRIERLRGVPQRDDHCPAARAIDQQIRMSETVKAAHKIGLALEPLDQAVDIALVGADARVHGDSPLPWSRGGCTPTW